MLLDNWIGLAVTMRVAYLVSRYPALSHAFVETEVISLRSAGIEVSTYTVRAGDPDQLLTERMRSEAAATTVLLRGALSMATAMLGLGLRRPRALAAGLRVALRSGPPTLRSKVWQIFYLAEAVILATDMQDRGLRHIHVHLANNGADVARLAVVLGRAMTGDGWSWSLAVHGPTEFADVLGHDLAAKVQDAAFTACITDFTRSQLMSLVPAATWPRLHVIHMTVEVDRWQPQAATRAARTPGPLRVLYVGRLVEAKAPSLLIEAVAALPPGSVALRIVGAGPLAAQLGAQIDRLGLSGTVTLVGPVGQDDLPGEYAQADVFCLPSFAEGLPVVLMEALATELPVVTTRIAGIPELVVDGETGLLVTPGRVDQLVDALARLAAHPELRQALGEAGRRAVAADFTPSAQAERLQALLKPLAAG